LSAKVLPATILAIVLLTELTQPGIRAVRSAAIHAADAVLPGRLL
jgi:hypothetical protein